MPRNEFSMKSSLEQTKLELCFDRNRVDRRREKNAPQLPTKLMRMTGK